MTLRRVDRKRSQAAKRGWETRRKNQHIRDSFLALARVRIAERKQTEKRTHEIYIRRCTCALNSSRKGPRHHVTCALYRVLDPRSPEGLRRKEAAERGWKTRRAREKAKI